MKGILERQESFGTIRYDTCHDTFELTSLIPEDLSYTLMGQSLSAPLTLHWITTLKCNARCPYCYELPSLLKKTDSEKILPPEQCERFISDFSSMGGVQAVFDRWRADSPSISRGHNQDGI